MSSRRAASNISVSPQEVIKRFIDCLFCLFPAQCKRTFVAVYRRGLCLAVFEGGFALAGCIKRIILSSCLGRTMWKCCVIPMWLCRDVIRFFRNACTSEERNNSYKSLLQNDQDEQDRNNRSEHIFSLQNRLDDAEREKNFAWKEVSNLKNKLKDSEQAKDEALSRLSEHVALKLADNNPNIADLSDINRPTNLAEKFSTLYDDEWTEAFEALSQKVGFKEESKAIHELLVIVQDCFRLCREESSIQLEQLLNAYKITKETAPKELLKLTKDTRKKHAGVYLPSVLQTISSHFNAINHLKELMRDKSINAYIKRCTALCWLMAIQDPPMAISSAVGLDKTYDKTRYREYTKTGKYMDYVVWPCILIQDGGNLMSKGIAQGRDHLEETIVTME